MENSGVGGNLVYLLTPQIWKKYNFKGNMFIKIQAMSEETSFRIMSELVESNLVVMREGMNYLGAV